MEKSVVMGRVSVVGGGVDDHPPETTKAEGGLGQKICISPGCGAV